MSRKPNKSLVDETLTINRPILEVFDFLSNHENYALWFPDVVSITSVNDLPHGSVGKVYSELLKLPAGRSRNITIEVVESRSPAVFITEGNFPPLHPRMEVRLFEKSARESILNWKFYSRSQSAFGRLIVGALIKKSVVKQSERGLKRLKIFLEEGAT
jgi:uncharacterized protein YndB with AHSA1/START domain